MRAKSGVKAGGAGGNFGDTPGLNGAATSA